MPPHGGETETNMKNCIYIFDSITNAIKAKRILSDNSILVNTIKISSKQRGGCTHGIEFDYRYSANINRILSASKIRFEEYIGDIS